MPLKVLGISTSPREGGNTDILLAEALAGAHAAGTQTEHLSLRTLAIAPCAECNACARTGVCRIQDDYHAVLGKMLDADRLVFATPVFFMGPCAQAKLLIDRCQCLWSRKYVLKQPVAPDGPPDRRALVIAVGGSRSKKMFDCVRLTMKYWFDSLGCAYAANLFVNQVDGRGRVREHPEAMKEAFRLGQALAGAAPVPQEPETVELFGPSGRRIRPISRRPHMKAATITSHGGPEVVLVQDVPDPQPAAGEVVIDVRAAALNHLDIWVRKGRPGLNLKFPHALGSDGAGVVSEVGPGVQNVRAGDEVILNPALSCGGCEYCLRGEQSECPSFSLIGMGRPGTFAERVAVPVACVHPKPAHLDFKAAAALPLAYVTAWRMLMTRARLAPGETLLIHGIGGGVALAGLQIAKLIGAEVIVTSSAPEKLNRARSLGADAVVNYRTEPDVTRKIRDLTSARGVDVVMDTVGAATWPLDFAVVRRGGRIVICGVTGGAAAETPLAVLYWNQISILGSTMGSHEDFRQMLRAVAEAKLEPVVDSAAPLDRAPEAMARMEAGEQFGKIVLTMGD